MYAKSITNFGYRLKSGDNAICNYAADDACALLHEWVSEQKYRFIVADRNDVKGRCFRWSIKQSEKKNALQTKIVHYYYIICFIEFTERIILILMHVATFVSHNQCINRELSSADIWKINERMNDKVKSRIAVTNWESVWAAITCVTDDLMLIKLLLQLRIYDCMKIRSDGGEWYNI